MQLKLLVKYLSLILLVFVLISCKSSSRIERFFESEMDSCENIEDSLTIYFTSTEKLEVSFVKDKTDTISKYFDEYFKHHLISKLDKTEIKGANFEFIIKQDKSLKKQQIALNLDYNQLFIRYNSNKEFEVIDIKIDSATLIPTEIIEKTSMEETLFLKYTCLKNQRK